MNEKCDIEELNVDLKTYDIDQKYKELGEAKFSGSLLITFKDFETDTIVAWFKNGNLHKEDGPAITTETREIWYEDFYLDGIKYGTVESNVSYYDMSDGKVFIPDEFLLHSYQKNEITFYEFLREDRIVTIPHIKGLVSNLTKKHYKVMEYAFVHIGHKFINDFHKFETEFWPSFVSGETTPENQQLKEAIKPWLLNLKPAAIPNDNLDEAFKAFLVS